MIQSWRQYRVSEAKLKDLQTKAALMGSTHDSTNDPEIAHWRAVIQQGLYSQANSIQFELTEFRQRMMEKVAQP